MQKVDRNIDSRQTKHEIDPVGYTQPCPVARLIELLCFISSSI